MRREIDSLLEAWRPAFRFNDQGLWNLLFYNRSAFFPLCVSGPPPAHAYQPEGSSDSFRPFIIDSLNGLGDAILSACGPDSKRRRPMYNHGLKDCLPQEEWDRKRRSMKSLSKEQLLGLQGYGRTPRAARSNGLRSSVFDSDNGPKL
eukprot:3738014-Amphidinium_carterae.1